MDDNAHAAYQRGATLQELGRDAEAESFYRQALAGAPGNSGVLSALASTVLAQQRPAEARAIAYESLAADPTNPQGGIVLSLAHLQLGDANGARRVIWHVLQDHPENPYAHHVCGVVALSADDPMAALTSAGRARMLAPEDPDPPLLAALAFAQQRRWPEARSAVAEGLALAPDYPYAHHVAGIVELQSGGGAPAAAAMTEAVRLRPTDRQARSNLGTALKSRNPVYGLLLRIGNLPRPAKIALVVGYILLMIFATPVALFIAFVTWSAEPVSNIGLMFSARGRATLTRGAVLSTIAYGVGLLGVLACLAGAFLGQPEFYLLALAVALWSMSASHLHWAKESWRLPLVLVHVAAAGLAVASAVQIAQHGNTVPTTVLLLGGVAMSWIVRGRGG